MRVSRVSDSRGVTFTVTFPITESHPLRDRLEKTAEANVREIRTLAEGYREYAEESLVIAEATTAASAEVGRAELKRDDAIGNLWRKVMES